MPTHLIFAILALVVLCLASLVQAIVGLTSAYRIRQVWNDETKESRGSRTVQSTIDPRRVIAASMLLLQILMAILATALLMEITYDWLAMGVVVLVYIVFGLGLPRAVAGMNSEVVLGRVLQFGRVASIILAPLEIVVDRTSRFFASILPQGDGEPESYGLEEEMMPRRNEKDDGIIGPDERVMIDGILSLEEMTARDIMVPRLDIVAVDRNVNPRELIDVIVKAGHSRIPVYQESIDRVMGILYAKDLLPYVIGNNRIPFFDLIRPAYVVPESKRLNSLFAEMRRSRVHLAVVADEYGGTAGLVTIEDVLEEIVGEIQDEYDSDDWLSDQPSPDVLIADGRLPIEDVEDALHLQFEEDDDFGTLGGFVHKHLGRLPIQGDAFVAEGVRVEILAVERHRIRRLRITKLPIEEIEEKAVDRTSRWRRDDREDTPILEETAANGTMDE
ncbi:MAG TPA: hemolysin family protein [Thermomicrobiales bacterium]|nr:hemolysin family protein [Thermomicrobiales bacterium]